MSRLSASSHPVSNMRRHDNMDNDATPQEAKQATAGRPQIDEKKRTSDERESGTGTMTSKQISPPPASSNRHQPTPPPTRRAGEQFKQAD